MISTDPAVEYLLFSMVNGQMHSPVPGKISDPQVRFLFDLGLIPEELSFGLQI